MSRYGFIVSAVKNRLAVSRRQMLARGAPATTPAAETHRMAKIPRSGRYGRAAAWEWVCSCHINKIGRTYSNRPCGFLV